MRKLLLSKEYFNMVSYFGLIFWWIEKAIPLTMVVKVLAIKGIMYILNWDMVENQDQE